jgi:hypothetical protein
LYVELGGIPDEPKARSPYVGLLGLAVELVDLHCFVEAAGLADSQRFVEEAGSVGLAVVVELPYLEVVEQNWSLQPLQKMYEGILD